MTAYVVNRRRFPRRLEQILVLVPYSDFLREAPKRFKQARWTRTEYSEPFFEFTWQGYREAGKIEYSILRAR